MAAVAGRQAQAKANSLLQVKCCTLTNCNNLLAKKNKKIRANLKIAQDEVKRLTSCLEDSHGQQNIATMTGSPPKYSDEVRHSGIQLLAHSAGIDHISPVMKCVIHTLTLYKVDRLPSSATLCDFLGEARLLVLEQIGVELLSSTDLTPHRDGTTKQGKKYYGAQVTIANRTLNLGLAEVKSGTADQCFQSVLGMLHDVEKVCVNARSSGQVFNEIVARIGNTMSDRRSLEKSCNALLQAFRSNVLPLVTAGWDSVVTEERERLCQVNNFYCELHYNYRRLGRANARKAW